MKKRKSKPSGLRKYWPHLTLKECEVERQKMSDRQNQSCAICKKHESNFVNRLAVDHNHKTGKVRGLLCYRCNKFLVGRHTIESSYKIYEYLLTYDEEACGQDSKVTEVPKGQRGEDESQGSKG